ncbi:MAG TPA: DUF4340 domain-containing protein [Azospirillum sp.]|nr:DUF4340 domain-containing protein [Azospirillum sp.]
MRGKPFIALAGVTVAAVIAAAVAVIGRHTADAPPQAGGALVPGLLARINDVTRVDVTGADGTATVARGEQGWIVLQKDGYRADADAVKALVVGLAEARVVEARTALPDLYDRLGVQDPGPGRESELVMLRAGDAVLASVILGKTASSSTRYVRRAGEAQSWMVKATLAPVPAEPLRWLDRALPRLPRDRVQAVEVRQPDGAAVTLRREAPADREFTVSGVERPRPSAVEQTVGALAALTFEDVAKADPALFKDAAVTIYRSFDGLTLTVRTARRDGQAWLTLAAEGDAPEVKEWQTKAAGWAYRVYDALADDLTRKGEDFAAKE